MVKPTRRNIQQTNRTPLDMRASWVLAEPGSCTNGEASPVKGKLLVQGLHLVTGAGKAIRKWKTIKTDA